MTKTKRMILFAACGVILLGVLAAVLFRFVIPKETGVCGDTATYKIVGDTLYIEGSGEMHNYRDPDSGTHRKLEDAPWWENRNSIRKIVIGEGIVTLGFNAFREMENLETVEAADTVDTVHWWTFEDCTSLVSFHGPGVIWVCPEAFKGCVSLKEFVGATGDGFLGSQFDEHAFHGCVSLERVEMQNTAVFYDSAFEGCESLREVTCSLAYEVGKNSFADCSSLESFPLDRCRADTIENGAFKNCTSLTSIQLPNGATEVPINFFLGCTGLTEVTLPEGLISIENNAFAGCTGIETLVLPSTVTEVHESAFRGWTAEQTIVVTDPDILPELAECEANIVTQ